MNNIINIGGLPPGAKASIIEFYEFVKRKYARTAKNKATPGQRLISLMEKGIYTLPKDFTFNREELYD